MERVFFVRQESYDLESLCAQVERLVGSVLEASDGGRRLGPGRRIWIKANLLAAHEPDSAVTTHPAVVEAVVRSLRRRGAVPLLADSPGGVMRDPSRVYRVTGMAALADRLGVELLAVEQQVSVPCTLSDGTQLYLSALLDRVDGVLNLPKLKTHALMLSTFALKNLYGVVPGFRKAEYHKLYPTPQRFAWLLAEIYDRLRPGLVMSLVDGIWGMDGNGPSAGKRKRFGLLAAAASGPALEAALEGLFGFRRPSPLSAELTRRGWVPPFDVQWLAGAPADVPAMELPSNWYMRFTPRWLARLLGRAVELYPAADPERCILCGECMRACPAGAITMRPGSTLPRFEYGACIRCLCCHELCPRGAVVFRKSRLARLLSQRDRMI
jgi:uncharacterized protein (DUF362 family)/ferredoxin